jgi:hypothetical protein
MLNSKKFWIFTATGAIALTAGLYFLFKEEEQKDVACEQED